MANLFPKLHAYVTENSKSAEGFINTFKFIWVDKEFGNEDFDENQEYVNELQSYGFSYIKCFNDIKKACVAIGGRAQTNNIILISSGSISIDNEETGDKGLISIISEKRLLK